MGQYYSPASDVVNGKVGYPLKNQGDTYASYFTQLGDDEYLYMTVLKGLGWLVLFIDSPAEFDNTYGHTANKADIRFYALPKSAHRFG